jgi:hypothetical protein
MQQFLTEGILSMGIINISDVRSGMVLAADVQDRNGRTLLAKGVEISDKHIRIFKMWGIAEADIQGVALEDVAAQEAAAVDPAVREKAEQTTLARFRFADLEHEGMKEISRLAIQRCVRTMTEAQDGRQSA